MTFAPQLTDEIAAAISDGRPVVALETTLVSHGFTGGRGLAVALESEERVRAAGATPATVGVLDGAVRVGLTAADLKRFADAGQAARKVGARDLAACVVQGALGSTTVGGTLAVCRAVGIRFVGTGGIGGVHRGFAETLDISADLPQLARTPAVVVCSGAKSILDVSATAELLETLAVPGTRLADGDAAVVLRRRGRPAGLRDGDGAGRGSVDSGDALAAGAGRPDTGPAARRWTRSSRRWSPRPSSGCDSAGVTGQAVTPAVLAAVEELTDGRSVEVNRRLIADNAELAARVAVAYAGLSPRSTIAATGPPPSGP